MSVLANMRIAFVAGTLGQGGAERQLFYQVRALVGAGAEVMVLSLTRGEFWEAPIEQAGALVVHVGRRASKPARAAAIAAQVRRFRPHVVQSAHFYTNPYAVLAGRLCGVPSIGAIRSDVVHEISGSGSILGWLCLRWPVTLAANSRPAIETARAMGARDARLVYVPNVVDTDVFRVAARLPREEVRFLAAGRLDSQKRFDRFVRLVAELWRAPGLPPVLARIVGDGSERRALEQLASSLASELGIDGPLVEFSGAVDDMARELGEADVFVLTSDYEGTPNVVLEAMASGLSVLATRVGSIPELVEHGVSGMLVDRDDVPGLLRHAVVLAREPELRRLLGDAARAFVVGAHSPEALSGHCERLYAGVLDVAARASKPASGDSEWETP